MIFHDLRVLLIAILAIVILIMRVHAQNSSSKTILMPNTNETFLYSNYTDHFYDDKHISRSSPVHDSFRTLLTISADGDDVQNGDTSVDVLKDDDSSANDNDYDLLKKSKEKQRQHSPKTHSNSKTLKISKDKLTRLGRDTSGEEELQQCGTNYKTKCCDGTIAAKDCDCRCGEGKDAVDPANCSPGYGAFSNRPTLYQDGNDDGIEDAVGSDTSTAARVTGNQISILSSQGPTGFLAVLIAYIFLFFVL